MVHQIFICESLSKDIFKDGILMANSGRRALFYNSDLGRSRIYRSQYPTSIKRFKILSFKNEKNAKKACDYINEIYNDNFIPKLISTI